MGINSKETDKINALIKLEKRIYKIYISIIKKKNKSLLFYLQRLIMVEAKEIESFGITREKYNQIEEYFISKSGVYIQSELPAGLDKLINENTYPYYRILARLRHELYESIPFELKIDSFRHLLIDEEIRILYNTLLRENNKELDEIIFYILIDSMSVELEVLKSSFKPFERIDNVVGLMTDTLLAAYIRKIRENLHQEVKIKGNADGNDMIVAKRIEETYLKTLDLIRIDSNPSDKYFILYVSYLKTLFAIAPPKLRQGLYAHIYEEIGKIPIEKRWTYYKILLSAITDTETKIIPSITNYSFHQKKKG